MPSSGRLSANIMTKIAILMVIISPQRTRLLYGSFIIKNNVQMGVPLGTVGCQ